jgi:hypothetical protein
MGSCITKKKNTTDDKEKPGKPEVQSRRLATMENHQNLISLSNFNSVKGEDVD